MEGSEKELYCRQKPKHSNSIFGENEILVEFEYAPK
jgi:hypothetical protein